MWNCILNFSGSDRYKIRSLTNDLFIAIIHVWKTYGIDVNANSTWDVSISTPSSHQNNVIVHSLFELAIISCNGISKKHQMRARNENLQLSENSNRKNFGYPVAEMLVVLYLHAFPIIKTDQKITDEVLTEAMIDFTQEEEETKVSIVQIPMKDFR